MKNNNNVKIEALVTDKNVIIKMSTIPIIFRLFLDLLLKRQDYY